ncbi:unnamed protein product, partial [Mycena citricolor]
MGGRHSHHMCGEIRYVMSMERVDPNRRRTKCSCPEPRRFKQLRSAGHMDDTRACSPRYAIRTFTSYRMEAGNYMLISGGHITDTRKFADMASM